MPTESELRALLQGEAGGEPRLDADRIIRLARARRRPRRIAVGALTGLAAVAVVVPVAVGVGSPGEPSPMSASDEAGVAATGQEGADDLSAPAERDGAGSLSEDPYPDCQLVGWDGSAVPSGVELLVSQPEPHAVELTLVNGSDETLSGELAGAPYLALGVGDEPRGWSAAPVEPLPVALAPGERMTFSVPLDPVGCEGGTLAGDYGAAVSLGIRMADGAVVVANSIRTAIVVPAA